MKCPRCGEALEDDAICEFCNEPDDGGVSTGSDHADNLFPPDGGTQHGEGEEYDNMKEIDDAMQD